MNATGADASPYVISVAAELTGIHPQTLRNYERAGLINPARSPGGGRRYSDADLHRLARIGQLSGEGINPLGIKRILELEAELADLRAHDTGPASPRTERRAPSGVRPRVERPPGVAQPRTFNAMRSQCAEFFTSRPVLKGGTFHGLVV